MYMVTFLVILHAQIDKFSYQLLITLKKGHHIDVGRLRPEGNCCALSWLDNSLKKYHIDQMKSV